MARFPKYQPSDEHRRQVMTMSGFGITQPEIARLIGCSDRTLRTYYRHELDTGATEANMRVAQSLYHMAVRDRIPSAAIFWMKARAGWKEARPSLLEDAERPSVVAINGPNATIIVRGGLPAGYRPEDDEADIEPLANGHGGNGSGKQSL